MQSRKLYLRDYIHGKRFENFSVSSSGFKIEEFADIYFRSYKLNFLIIRSVKEEDT